MSDIMEFVKYKQAELDGNKVENVVTIVEFNKGKKMKFESTGFDFTLENNIPDFSNPHEIRERIFNDRKSEMKLYVNRICVENEKMHVV